MDIPPEAIAAKEALEGSLLATGLITGIDFGVRDELEPDPDDLALRVFVADLNAVPFEVQLAIGALPFPVVVLQRIFVVTQAQLPDVIRHRPLEGGVSIAASRFLASGEVPTGTLGAIVSDVNDPSILYGLSNHHVLCGDLGRQRGDEIVQPEPSILGSLPGDRVGTLHDWAFPETSREGFVDAAIFRLEVGAIPAIAEIGPTFGTVAARPVMPVTKRGKTTGRTFGWISGIHGSYPLEFPRLPAVGTPPTVFRIIKDQIQIHIDFPQSIVFGASGDSGSVVLDGSSRVVGLYWGSGTDAAGNPLRFGLATPAAAVMAALPITF